jgi:hypothetical protein
MDQVKKRITSRQWNRVRFAFQRTVEFGRKAVLEKKNSPQLQAAQSTLLEALGPLSKKERRILQDALVEVAITIPRLVGDDLANQADALILNLGISL